MKFESYPHDTQICSMMIESCRFHKFHAYFGNNVTRLFVIAVSHTDHDLVFIWNMTDPLVVNPEIELPQLDISNNYTADCTIEYSTGKAVRASQLVLFMPVRNFQEILRA